MSDRDEVKNDNYTDIVASVKNLRSKFQAEVNELQKQSLKTDRNLAIVALSVIILGLVVIL